MDEISFYMLIDELKDTHFFPTTHKLRVYKIFNLFYHFQQLFKDPYLKKVQEEKFEKRHRSQKKLLKKKNLIDSFIRTALPPETYNKYLHKDEKDHPSFYEGTYWGSWLTELVEKGNISYNKLAELLPGISGREKMGRSAVKEQYEKFEKAMDDLYDEKDDRPSKIDNLYHKLLLIILKRTLYRKLIEARAELAWILKEGVRFGKFEVLDEEEEERREEKITSILDYFKRLPRN